jgi:hypothetical protein
LVTSIVRPPASSSASRNATASSRSGFRVREQRRKKLELVLLFQAADRSHFGDAGKRLQRGLELRFIEQPHLARIAKLFVIDQRVLVDPADTARVGPDRHRCVGGQELPDRRKAVRDQLAHDGAFRGALQDHVDERVAHVRRRADRANVGRADQRLHDRLGDLLFEKLGTPRPLRVNNHLRIGSIWNRVERRRAHREKARDDPGQDQ